MKRCSSILLIALDEECAQKFSQKYLESHLARTFVVCDLCDIEDNISQLLGVAMNAWQRQ